ncbi:DEAD/DEAH box helicase family protein [Sphingobacterium hungaricum]|uniref:Restriction endonuclease subunit R n=1 Tax=Sphingobacterium hungaricum TaxID=2082723 RepID=A0A928YQY5_9SPHI|nr:DEAD/DEAH box helicase family protein [Sphingobacterium hungaricum]MBE8714746.1 restriction endonuclease subunit R [Sphingobacterium hungaricum]
MKQFPAEAKFIYPWRSYQKRVLDELSTHLSDEHLHVIAPPGSGKTVLGLEVMLRINKPTLILSPTLAIRDQWIQRLCQLFLQTDHPPEWISTDIRNPKLLTIVTYQGLHAACNSQRHKLEVAYDDETDVKIRSKSNFLNLDNIAKKLKDQGVETFIADEAHHLKNEWWKTLIHLKNTLKPHVVGLTATPPYDVSEKEWFRYMELNGTIDAEITVPELILEGDLCAHQDFVYFSEPTDEEAVSIKKWREKGTRLFNVLKNDPHLVEAFCSHPLWVDPQDQLVWISNNLSVYLASLVFLKENGFEIEVKHVAFVGAKAQKSEDDFPALSIELFEQVLLFYLFDPNCYFQDKYPDKHEEYRNKLQHAGVLDKKKVSFDFSSSISKVLGFSLGKLESIQQLVAFENKQLGSDLRMVILSDYVRKEFLVKSSENDLEINKMGVLPIFEKLRRAHGSSIKLAVLTGSIVIIPLDAYQLFLARFPTNTNENTSVQSLLYDSGYVLVSQSEHLSHGLVHAITDLFQEGLIEVLIGTKSLLGEGWDAPAINSLILASFVGSYVSSNQMRGRAIRSLISNSKKTSSIWHLASFDGTDAMGGDDVSLLQRRFKSYVGISERHPGNIENGLSRLNLPLENLTHEEILFQNQQTLETASQRDLLIDKWNAAIPNGIQLVEELKVPYFEKGKYELKKSAQLRKSVEYTLVTLLSSILFFLESSAQVVSNALRFVSPNQHSAIYMGLFIVGMSFFGWRSFKAIRLYISYRDLTKDIFEIANALLATVCKVNIFATPKSQLNVLTYANNEGSVYCHLEGGTTYEKNLFIQLIQEIIDPIDNPRYIIIRKSSLFSLVKQYDFHAVPELLGRKKALAEEFAKNWNDMVGDCYLIYGKSDEGVKLVLKAKVKSLSAQFSEEMAIQHVNIWR